MNSKKLTLISKKGRNILMRKIYLLFGIYGLSESWCDNRSLNIRLVKKTQINTLAKNQRYPLFRGGLLN